MHQRLNRTYWYITFPSALLVCGLLFPTSAGAQGESTPPPGRLIDVGGWRLHLNCTGEAQPSKPTIILEPDLGDFSVEWSLIQLDEPELVINSIRETFQAALKRK